MGPLPTQSTPWFASLLYTSPPHPPVSHFLGEWVHLVVLAASLSQGLGAPAQTRCHSLVQNKSWGRQCSRQVPGPRALGLCYPCWLPQVSTLMSPKPWPSQRGRERKGREEAGKQAGCAQEVPVVAQDGRAGGRTTLAKNIAPSVHRPPVSSTLHHCYCDVPNQG